MFPSRDRVRTLGPTRWAMVEGWASDLLPRTIDVHDLNVVRACVPWLSFLFAIPG